MKEDLEYSIALQRAIWYHCQGVIIPENIAKKCPHNATMLNEDLKRSQSLTIHNHENLSRKVEGLLL